MKSNASFVMPHYNAGSEQDIQLTEKVISRICKQLDSESRLIIVDDASPLRASVDMLSNMAQRNRESIELLCLPRNEGPGVARNKGIDRAAELNSEILLFNDSDDIPACNRLEVVRRLHQENKGEKVIYSGFIPVTDADHEVSKDKITGSLLEIIAAINKQPVEGDQAWITIGTRTGYINLTSSTAVSIKTAVTNPFPAECVSEDSHTWFRYSGSGAKYIYTDEIPTRYRITETHAGSNSRNSSGIQFYADKCRVDTDGFKSAIYLAHRRSEISIPKQQELLSLFYLKLALTMNSEGCFELTADMIKSACDTDVHTVIRELEFNQDLLKVYHEMTSEFPGFLKAA